MGGREVDQGAPFLRLANLCERLELTTRRPELARLVGDFLRSLHEEETPAAVYLIVGTIFPESDPRRLDVSWKTVRKVLSGLDRGASGRNPLAIP